MHVVPESDPVDAYVASTGLPDGSPANTVARDERSLGFAHRAFTVTWIAALAAVALAIAVNWFFSPGAGDPFPGRVGPEPLPEPAAFVPERTAVDLLPSRVLSYETITLQAIPGQEDRAAEAIYVTLNMDVEVQRPMNSYARVEQYPSSAEAEQRAEELMRPYPVDQSDTIAGQATIASAGFANDDSAYNVVWTKGTSVYMVKTSFRDIPPVRDARKLLSNVAKPVIDGVADHVPGDE